MKKLLTLLLTAAMAVSVLTGCGGASSSSAAPSASGATSAAGSQAAKDVKIGFIFLHDENSTYDKNFIDAAKAVKEKLGLSDDQVIFKTNIPESSECYEAAADLADRGCDIVFADSFGHEQYIAQAAEEFPEVQFCHATGTTAHTADLPNFHNAFASIYEGRYLAGIAAGMKLNEMIENGEFTAEEAKIGYIGAYTYAEVISGYTAFYLGAKSVCPTATMDVQFTGSWYDETAEKEAANLLIGRSSKLISQHADSMGAPTACETAGVPNISYNGSTLSACPNTFIVSSRIDWEPYFEYIITSFLNGEAIDADWSHGLDEGSVVLTDLNEKVAAAGTADALKEAKEKLVAGELHVFDTATFTVKGETLTSYMADVDTDANYTPDTEVIEDGYFHESEKRSAPYFDLRIDGINTLNEKF
ncbi:MAG: BMP family ABC transporter substrate-binding protein [Pygmaiobacter massiliensis]|uniref:BMP family ABC transporter substrate-binding protein n=1 Tax=Pygmaiobacter massiliensis TaxID=1917873 RepID=UPI002A821E82|nr:BMP family ABC transporter substrate-binding protein [Pygmaiobacter massiliensis]MDY4783979.1 BMP family ABC transporter substrate-binding protein [Pygmaiobacter massiliensis]